MLITTTFPISFTISITTTFPTSFTTSIITSFFTTKSYEAPLPEGNTLGSAEDSVPLKELMVLVPKLVTKINSSEKDLKDTKQTLGNVVLKLVKKVKTLETALKRKSKKGVSKEKSTDKGKRYRRRARSIAKKIDIGLDAKEEINTGIEE
ncbi:hypothetical protein Tco_0080928, partial [Tanacetum coccineum]